MKRLGIDARLIGQTGVGVYIKNLLLHLEKIVLPEWEVYVYLIKEDLDNIHFANKKFVKRRADYHWHTLSEQTGFLSLLNKDALNLMHFTYFSYPMLYKKPFVSTVHDLTPLIFKTGKASTKNPLVYEFKHIFLKKVLSALVKNSQSIITPTSVVKKQIINYFGLTYHEKIRVTHEGVDEELKTSKGKKPQKELPQKYLLYIGNFYPHKNLHNLIEAFIRVADDSSLILVGPNDAFAEKLKQSIEQYGLDHKIGFYHNVEKEEIAYFYKHAEALIHPSLAEGFGLTLLEAAYFQCPIIASRIPVFEELYKGFYFSFDPTDISAIKGAIESVLVKKPHVDYAKLLQKYSFEKMAKETVEIYKKHL